MPVRVREAAMNAAAELRKLRRRPAHPLVLRVALAKHSYLNDLATRGVESIAAEELPGVPSNLARAKALVGGSVADLRKHLDALDREDQEIVRLARELETFGANRSSARDALDGFLEDVGQ